jgi:cobyrinic acid a,c-diamide synthase
LAKGLVIAAPASGSGKTIVTLGLLRALHNRGHRVASAKVGPDYIDPRFHEAATGRPCFNLDPWAMSGTQVRACLDDASTGAEIVVVEGVMGLLDGPLGANASTADLARTLGLPVIIVIDCSHMAQTIGILADGFLREGGNVCGFILNRVASERHEAVLREGLGTHQRFIRGIIYQNETLALPSRHLGLVQAEEHGELDAFMEKAAAHMEKSLDVEALLSLCETPSAISGSNARLPPLGQHIAVAADRAFAFCYAHFLHGWRTQGAEISFFSPLADETPSPHADAIFLPGGYPELHAGRIAAAQRFLSALRSSNALVYGECGGFMVLGEELEDQEGNTHAMAGCLPVKTTFAKRKLNLGYRELRHQSPLPFPATLRGHEFHYSTIAWQGQAEPLFEAKDATGSTLPRLGLRRNKIMGSYAHVIA